MTEKTVLIVGATGGIGHAMLKNLVHDDSVKQIYATYRRRLPSDTYPKVQWVKMEVTDEVSIKDAIQTITDDATYLSWVINAVGVLHTEKHTPEKSLSQLESDFFVQNMRVNALGSLLLAKHIKPLLKASPRTESQPAIFATISARVGSISDNQLGGWYSYRMSKAALNMGMKTLSIEWQRSLKNVCVTVMQPGTVDTPLSQPFQKNVPKDKLFDADDAAKNLLTVLSQLRTQDTGSFVDWAGESIAW